MKKKTYQFSTKKVDYYFDAEFSYLDELVGREYAVVITDANIFNANKKKFKGWHVIVIQPGEANKIQATVDSVISQLIALQADRETFLIGIGGGVITDLTGYIASIYMRGIRCGFVPTTILAMVDAAVGGKNGIDIGPYKNLVGSIRQPEFLLYDTSFLKTLPKNEWVNGFAEIIKHACIKDAGLFRQLEQRNIAFYQKDKQQLNKLIQRNASIKSEVVERDEFEKAERKLLNFGHTLGHAIETQYGLPHGHAISIGMVAACRLAEQVNGFRQTEKVIAVLNGYGLPTSLSYDKEKVFDVLKMDKKKVKNEMKYVLLEKIGKGVVVSIPLDQLEKLINQL